ncbi:MAG: polyprenol monophosphomannose synthase [Candidatus Thorarchaeota archaeon]
MKSVIIPTLNEAENIEDLIRKIYEFLPPTETNVIVVDDNSRDATHEIVMKLQDEYPNLSLVVRKNERGLGSAVQAGAFLIPEGPVVVMDGDLSHHPRFLPSIFQKLTEGYDIVAGSRYVPGGDIVGWPGSRIAISKVATLMARTLFRIKPTDPMTGFVGCSSAKLLVNGFKHADYKFYLEMMVTDRALRIAEVPIVFRDREKGKSKLDGKTIALYLLLLLRLLFGERRTITNG